MSWIELTGGDGAQRVMRWPAETSEGDLMRMSRRYLVAAFLEARRRQSHPYISALEEIARAVAETEPYFLEQPYGWHCQLCSGWSPDSEYRFQHDDDCPVTLAKKLPAR